MEGKKRQAHTTGPIPPRIILHGGAGNITRASLPRGAYDEYRSSLLRIVDAAARKLAEPGATALDVATYAVALLEEDALYNSAHGAVFTRGGKNELEASVMVSDGYRKKGVGCTLLTRVRNPIKLARKLLVRGEEVDGGGGAGDHCFYSGEVAEGLARKWGLDMVEPSWFFTQRRWDEHLRGLEEEKEGKMAGGVGVQGTSEWEKSHYVPLGTCGAVVVDSYGTICTATSTGGLTNKVDGRVGDTPTIGAGFWAEEWYEDAAAAAAAAKMLYQPVSQAVAPIDKLSRGDLHGALDGCLPILGSSSSRQTAPMPSQDNKEPTPIRHAVALSGTGNGDSFLRTSAARTTAAKSRFSSQSLSDATTWMAGRGGELQKSAGNRWDGVHEGVGGIIGIELVGNRVQVVQDYNCGGMFRAWTEENGSRKCLIFREDRWESGPHSWQDI
ncbi:hypothetical protein COCC4DRAFT_154766 [Bipolaris maydis ATCC 48331]|uniref:N-terminal nucleophile aminohydrolase n=1 Tax=Cochliobolus heterostrophus (strain C4 / ATCC 48331 / race T) TaxID=665024 RepID=N4WHZ4_COCH4|nr:uncharacterized protein COCC4DRAFT_154766 [Bipolaris maydis ATCC 48331]ENH98849.1 hypothetical protein COCC4DRAFT_154766 [Bipolaris maydis ATCC 48331]KAJ5020375.1 nucleophile aminohydrolase [Bipolaris maydis]KAJ6199879.1 nucleophile aminohydrolase [Bipolaris maydis]